MTTEELYEAFRKKYQDDIRSIPRAVMSALDQNAVNAYLDKLKQGKPNLTALTDGELCELMSITRRGDAERCASVRSLSAGISAAALHHSHCSTGHRDR